MPGITAVLHACLPTVAGTAKAGTRQYEYHPHVHFIATGGGINARGQWLESHPKFLIPVEGLSPVMRARFRDALYAQHPDIFRTVSSKVWKQDWVVHSEPVGSGEKALLYLSRYVQRVALSERAILHHDQECITVRYRKSGTNQPRTMRLKLMEFIRRFLQHACPP